VIKLKRMRWAGNVARTMNRRGAYGVLVGSLSKETTWKRYAQLDLGRAWRGLATTTFNVILFCGTPAVISSRNYPCVKHEYRAIIFFAKSQFALFSLNEHSPKGMMILSMDLSHLLSVTCRIHSLHLGLFNPLTPNDL
jgi:hypothetical protein